MRLQEHGPPPPIASDGPSVVEAPAKSPSASSEIPSLRQLGYDFEAHVVAGLPVGSARVSEPHHEAGCLDLGVFHGILSARAAPLLAAFFFAGLFLLADDFRLGRGLFLGHLDLFGQHVHRADQIVPVADQRSAVRQR